ncbi:co-chaperone YbbN [Paenibacillus sp. MSJ-34]|uniref:thioredoxin family protein n=1 Tax=Paenibacillus sp. MSJ-34 TaxID=2841529 RepID=UPI001C10AC9E|nr:thioredoxin family protein [Paenibacillus sp. MSJ-34]MBU5441461.1 thioredoxin family protein [Paenibacillus sp. MSJ-34]
MEKITSTEQFETLIQGEKPVMAVFKANWCKDCHFIDPFMPDVEEKYADKLTLIEIDRDEFPDLCDHYQILGIPSFIAFSQGKELVRFVSKLRKTREEIEQFFDRALQVAETLQQG